MGENRKKHILFLDDALERHLQFQKKFNYPNAIVTYVHTVEEANKELDTGFYDVAFLDHDLGGRMFVKEVEGTGTEVALHIAHMPERKRPYQVIIHSHNPAGAIRMKNILDGAVKKVQVIPFSILVQSL